jgi:uncharacterized membrane protein
MNDWELTKTLVVTAVLQVVFLGSAGLNYLGAPVLIIQQVTGLIFLLFIPGILLLRVLKLHNLGSVRTPLFAVGLSITTLMFSGLVINQAYPYLGIARPIAALPLLVTLSAEVDVLCLVALVRDKDFSAADSLELRAIITPFTLALCLIPFVSVFGTYVMNHTSNNTVLLLLIVFLAATVVLVTFRREVPPHVYPLAVFVSGLSLLYYETLITNYLQGYDILLEKYLAGLVVASGSWSATLSLSYYNSALSVVWLFKVVYPLIFALVPVALYLVFRAQTNDKVAFVSAFLFVAVQEFFVELSAIARQEIGELFLVLIILVIVDKQLKRRNLLTIIFAFALIVAHYSLSYVFISLLIAALLGLTVLDLPIIQRISRLRQSRSAVKNPATRSAGSTKRVTRRSLVTWGFVALFMVVSQLWYIYSAGGSAFYSLVSALNFIAGGLQTEFLATNTTGAGVITAATTSPLYSVAKDMYLLVEFLIVVGVIALLAKKTRMRFDREYAALAVASMALLVVVLVVPFVAGFLNTSRFFQIGLIFLAPFVAIGGIAIVRAAGSVIRVPCNWNCEYNFLKAFSIFLVLFLMFTTGFVYAVVSPSVSKSVSLNASFDAPRFNDLEVAGAAWLGAERSNATPAYADGYRVTLLASFPGGGAPFPANYSVPGGTYVYLGTLNVQQGKIVGLIFNTGQGASAYSNASVVTSGRSRLYDNGGAQVYY